MVMISSWGRLEQKEHRITALSDRGQIARELSTHRPGIAYGMGRSYGDECLNPGGCLWLTAGLDQFIQFDQGTGRLTCESGVTLRGIQRLLAPRGWMLPVTPGTQMVTVGGCIANDVHGKNHHRYGSFGDHVLRVKLQRTDGNVIECGPDHASEWFSATVGGLGLTGLITEAEIQLRPIMGPWLDTETIAFDSIDEFFPLSDNSEGDCEYTVAWVDCTSRHTSRGLFMRGNHNADTTWPMSSKKPLKVPVVPPISLVNKFSLRPFNAAYYYSKKSFARKASTFYESFFYPLDNVLEWNRMYGPRGFYQYQSVIPMDVGSDATKEMLRQIALSGEGSFLAVLKTFGAREAKGMLSFPMHGVSLALDFPNRNGQTHALFERLDAVVREAKGRIYPAKDVRMPRELFEAGFPRISEFQPFRDPGISSAMSRRLLGA
jgi:FAD/FMN-containing dehydrogenase